MTTRDRLMLMGIVALAVLVGAWFMVVAPEREKASKVNAEVQAARQQVATAESQANSAAGSRAQYSTAYASLVSLGQAVPSTPETPGLIYTLDKATHRRDVQFSSIATGSSGSSSSSPSASAAPTAAGSAFTQEPFTFVFNGNFVDLYKLLNQLEDFTLQTSSGTLRVSGRLLTIDSVNLSPIAEGQSSSSSKPKSNQLTGTITATAYVLPSGQAALGGASPAGPSAAGSAATAASTSSTSTSSGTAPAVVKANP